MNATTETGTPRVVLLHGFMGAPDDLAPFARSLGVQARFLFPGGLVDLAPVGLRGRAWWPVDTDARADSIARGPRDLSTFVPEGLHAARAHLDKLLDDLEREGPPGPLVLGGFSQGAMLSCELALCTARPLAGLVLFSGARIAADAWRARYGSRRGQRVFVSHGRSDGDLSFAAAESFQRELADAGWDVTWCPFDGGHEIPLVAWRAFKRWLTSVPRSDLRRRTGVERPGRALRARGRAGRVEGHLLRAAGRDVEVVVVRLEAANLELHRLRQSPRPQRELPGSPRRARHRAGFQSDVGLLLRRKPAREVERLAANHARGTIEQGRDRRIVRRRTETVRVAHVEEVVEQLGQAEPGDAPRADLHGLRDVHHGGFAAEERDPNLRVERERSVVDHVHVEPVEPLVHQKHGCGLERPSKVVVRSLGSAARVQ